MENLLQRTLMQYEEAFQAGESGTSGRRKGTSASVFWIPSPLAGRWNLVPCGTQTLTQTLTSSSPPPESVKS